MIIMEATEFILLREENEALIMQKICSVLGIEAVEASCITASAKEYELNICVVGLSMEQDSCAFFKRQIEYFVQYYEQMPMNSVAHARSILAHIKQSKSLVIVHYLAQGLAYVLSERVDQIANMLVQEFAGLHLMDYGNTLRDKDLLLMFPEGDTYITSLPNI